MTAACFNSVISSDDAARALALALAAGWQEKPAAGVFIPPWVCILPCRTEILNHAQLSKRRVEWIIPLHSFTPLFLPNATPLFYSVDVFKKSGVAFGRKSGVKEEWSDM